MLATEPARFEHIAKEVTVYRGTAANGVTPVNVAIDKGGKKVDLNDLKKADDDARYAAVGALSGELAERLQTTKKDEFVQVYLSASGMWPELDRYRLEGDEGYAEAYEKDLAASLDDSHKRLTAALADLGYLPDHYLFRAPMVHAVVSPEDLWTLAYDERVTSIDPDDGVGTPTSADWLYDTQIDQAHDWGFTGTNEQISLILYDKPRAADDGVVIDYQAPVASPSGQESQRASWVIGAIKSLDAGMPNEVPQRDAGSAPQALTYVANEHLFQYIDTIEQWSYDQGARVMVYGRAGNSPATLTQGAHDKYIDFIMRHSMCSRTYCVQYIGSSGNRNYTTEDWGECSYPTSFRVQNRFLNGLVVGGSSRSVATSRQAGWWETYDPYSCSAWQNPRAGGISSPVELPHVVAPAEFVDAGGKVNGPGGFRGTSASAAIVGGLSALLLQSQPLLRLRPEALRAVLIASAWQDVDGSALVMGVGDSLDGAGQVSAARAMYVSGSYDLARNHGWWGGLANFTSNFTNNWLYKTWSVPILPGETLRVALDWTGHTSCASPPASCNSTTIDADLGLYVFDGTNLVAWSDSSGNWEFVYYPRPSNQPAATLTIQVYKNSQSVDVTGTYIGIAWDTLVDGGYLHDGVCNTTTSQVTSTDFDPSLVRRMPAVAALENGEYAGTWVQGAVGGNGTAVAQLFSKDGLVKSDATISGWSSGYAFWPRIAALDWDRFVIAYRDGAGGKVKARVFDKYTPNPPGDDVNVAGDVPGSHYLPDVAGYHARNPGNPADDVLFWTTWLGTTGPTVYLRRCVLSPAQDPPCDDEIAVDNFGWMGPEDLFPAVAVVPPTAPANLRGSAIVVWTDDHGNGNNEGDLLGRAFFYPAGLQGPQIVVPFPGPIGDGSNNDKQMRPDIAMFPDGTFVVAWIGKGTTGSGSSGNVKYRLYQPQCAGWNCQITPLGTPPGMTEQFACDTTNTNPNPAYNCSNVVSKAAGFDNNHGRVALVANIVNGNREFKVGYTYGTTSLTFYTRYIRPNAATGAPGFIGQGLYPGFALNGTAPGKNAVNGGAIDMWPECGMDVFALWGACSQGSCEELNQGPDYWMNSAAAPW